jgi:hypothetical protein
LRLFQLPLALLALLALAPGARAQYTSSPFSYNYLDINYSRTELKETTDVPELEGYGGRLSFDSPEGVRIILAYDETFAKDFAPPNNEVRDVWRQDLEAGVGFITNPSDVIDLLLDVKYLRGEFQTPTSANTWKNLTRSGYGVEFGMRSLLHEMVEFDLSVEYRDYFTAEFGGHAGVVFMFTENFGIQARYTHFESQEKLVGGLRLAI